MDVKSAPVDTRTPSSLRSRRRSVGSIVLVTAALLTAGACGGDDDDADATADATADDATTTTVSSSVTLSPADNTTTTTTAAPTTTTLPALELVTEGATVVVANASGIDGSAGRMTDALAEVGFATGTATNSSEGQLATSKVYYDPANEDARAVADSLREALGAGDIEVLELAVPAPTSDGEIGDASILLAMGNDTADKTLDELQGRVAPADDTGDEETGDATDEATGDGTDEATGDGTGDDTADG